MKTAVIIFILLLIPCIGLCEGIQNYVILGDIGQFRYRPKATKALYGNSGVLISADHFYLDHADITYKARYIQPEPLVGADLQLTQHVGSQSDIWLMHEIEDAYRSSTAETLGLVTKGARLRDINGKRFISLRGSGYTWIADRAVVDISYNDIDGTKPEPLEVVQAYLQKFPSTIPATLTLDRAHDEQWIKTEMERRLWLCDKWFLWVQSGKANLANVLQNIVDHVNVFLDYRDKYYGISARNDKAALIGFATSKDGTSVKSKVSEYKAWWTANRTRSITLP